MYISEWFYQDINIQSSLSVFKRLKSSFGWSYYLTKMKISSHRNAVAKLRLSAHNLYIETGRHRNISRNDRNRSLCSLQELEDEFHFMLVCPAYTDLSKTNIKMYYYQNPSMLKLIQLLNSSNIKAFNAVGIYYIQANEERNNRLNNVIV